MTDKRYLRLLTKFVEHDFVKVHRLIELHDKYARQVRETDLKFSQLTLNEDFSDEDLYLARLESGLFTLQMVDMIVAYVVLSPDTRIRDQVLLLLEQKDHTLEHVCATLRGYKDSFGTAEGQVIGPTAGDELARSAQMRGYIDDLITGLAMPEHTGKEMA